MILALNLKCMHIVSLFFEMAAAEWWQILCVAFTVLWLLTKESVGIILELSKINKILWLR